VRGDHASHAADLHRRRQHLALHPVVGALLGIARQQQDLLHDLHARRHASEDRVAVVVLLDLAVERLEVADDEEEIRCRGAGILARHRDRAVQVREARRIRCLVQDRLEHLLRVPLQPALHQAVVPGLVDLHGAIELAVVEALRIDVAQEVAGGDRGAAGVELHGDRTEGRLDHDGDPPVRGLASRRRCEDRTGDKQETGKDGGCARHGGDPVVRCPQG
jgi:hypothetical protein